MIKANANEAMADPAFVPHAACACGRHYDVESWDELRLLGVMAFDDEAPLELRDCKCGSTISVEVGDRDGIGEQLQ